MDPLSFDLDATSPPNCGVTRYTLRRLHAGEFPPEERERLLTHTKECLDCQTILAELRSDEAAFRTHIPFNRFVADHEKRAAALESQRSPLLKAWWAWLTGGTTALALAGAAAFMMLAPKTSIEAARPEAEWDGIKGKPISVHFLVKTPEGIRPGRRGEALKEGDQIQLMARGPAQGMGVVVVDVDGAGNVSVMHAGEAPSAGVSAAAPLSDSIILDDAVGPERLFVIYAPQQLLTQVQGAAEAAAKKLVEQKVDLTSVDRLPVGLPVGQDSVLFVKVPR